MFIHTDLESHLSLKIVLFSIKQSYQLFLQVQLSYQKHNYLNLILKYLSFSNRP